MKYVLIGNSAAGLFAAEAIRQQEVQAEITVLTVDDSPSYSRCLTTYYLAGDIDEAQLFLRTPEAIAALNLNIHYSCPVTGLIPEQQVVLTSIGERFSYDKCLIATGSSAVSLNIPGANLPEVFTLRHLEDAKRIKALLASGRRAVIIGGGLVSLKSAYALCKQGLEVHVIVSSGHLLSQMLNPDAASILEEHLRQHGLDIILNSDVAAIEGEEHVKYVRLRDGRTLTADLVIVGKGVRPNIAPFLTSGLEVRQGILVNDRLETNLPNVYAAGDVAEAWDLVRGTHRINAIWPNATQQGRIAGMNMTGQSCIYPGSLGMNAVDFFGLRIVSAGMINPPTSSVYGNALDSDPWYTEDFSLPSFADQPSYQRMVWQGETLKGFVLIGNTERAGILTALIQAKQPLSLSIRRDIRNGKRGRLPMALRNNIFGD
jgi:NAD(P)H-nitrite reductase large subunit